MERDRFHDRHEAGRRLAGALTVYRGRPGVLVLALPRGGVPVAWEVAQALGAPLDVMLVRKLGVPGHEELAMGAIATGGVRIVSEDVVAALGIPERAIAAAAADEERELRRRERVYRDDRPPAEVAGRIVVLVDDGLATGATMRAAASAVRAQGPERVIVAVPVAPPDTCRTLGEVADEVHCLLTPGRFGAVGEWYDDFSQTSDEEVRAILGSQGLEARR